MGEFLEEGCVNPTFICDQPQLMSPLAKWCARAVTASIDVAVQTACNIAYSILHFLLVNANFNRLRKLGVGDMLWH